jgi:hypothetical protein
MHQARAWTYGLFIVSWLCWLSSLLIGAQNLITDPIEGDFDSVCPLFNYLMMIHMQAYFGNHSHGDTCLEVTRSTWKPVLFIHKSYNK